MKAIFTRSPYYVIIDELTQVGGKLELSFRKFGETYPVDPDIVLSKKVPSPTQLETVFNISPYCDDRIKPIKQTAVNDNDCFVFVQIKRYVETETNVFSLLDTEEFVCLNGYLDYFEGSNNFIDLSSIIIFPLIDTQIVIKRNDTVFVNIGILHNGTDKWEVENVTKTILLDNTDSAGFYFLKVPLAVNETKILKNDTLSRLILSEQICEPKYTPKLVTFVNKLGGWQPFTFFKAHQENLEVSKDNYSLMQSWNYDKYVGIKQGFNHKITETIKLSTGWVDENYSELVKQLMLSPKIMLDDKPVIIKTTSISKKNIFIDKNINYEIEFEYAW